MYTISYFVTSSGKCPILKFVAKHGPETQVVFNELLEAFRIYGFHLSTKQLRKISGTRHLWELRTKHDSVEYRFLIAKINKHEVVVLHGFKKKTQKTPQKEITIAQKRLQKLK